MPTSTGWVGANDWTDPENALSCNDQYATQTGDAADYYLQGYEDFDFPDLTGQTIDGIEVQIHAKSTEGGKFVRCEIYSTSAGTWSDVKTDSFASSEEMKAYGGAVEKWGTTWVPSDFTNDNFYLRISSEKEISNLSVDCIEVKVYSS